MDNLIGLIITGVVVLFVLIVILSSIKIVNTGYLCCRKVWSIPQNFRTRMALLNSFCRFC